MACDIELLQELPDPPDFVDDLDNLDDPGDDWVSLLLDEDSAALGDFDPLASLADILPQTPGPSQPPAHRENLTASPSSGLTHLSGSCSPSSSQEDNLKEEEAAGSGTEQCRSDGEQKKQTGSAKPSSSGESNCRTSKKLGKRKIDYEEEIKPDDGEVDDEELKRRARLMRNRESAQLSRQRKKAYVDDLEERVRTLNATVAELNNTVNLISAENVNLRHQLAYFYHSNNGAAAKPGTFAPAPPVGMPIFPYPGGYVARPLRPGSSAPPVPIPRLKTQASSVKSVKRAKTSKEDGQKKAGTGKTKKLASVAALGFLCIMMFVFPFDLGVPGLQSRTVETSSSSSWSQASVVNSGGSSAVNRIGGRVLMSWEKDPNNTDRVDWPPDDRCGNANRRGAVHIDGSIFPANVSTYGNASDRFPASLILPQEDRMVKIDGDLIIQAVMAGDKAASNLKDTKGLSRQAKEVSHAPALMSSFQDIAAKALLQKQRALPASDDHQALPSGDVQPDFQQQAMLNELAGTVFSSGMCSEVFQFEISPGTSESGNISAEPPSNPTQGKRSGGHRRNLSAVPIPSRAAPKGKKYNSSSSSSAAGGFSERRPSSMVVSIFNPKQVQSAGAKDLARIFVVVLVDSVKYVTYSCVLPPQPQVVTG